MNAATQNQNRPRQTEARSTRGFITPPANVSMTDTEYVLEVEMPGVNKNGLETTVEGNELTIIGRRSMDLPEGELFYCETPSADFRRVFELGPDVDTTKINAKLEQGVLTLHLPKSEKAKPKKIEVQAA